MNMPAILDALKRDHADMSSLLHIARRQFAVFDDAGSVDFDIVADVMSYCRDYPDIRHHPIEDRLYIMLRRLNPEMAAAAGPLVAEHGALSDMAASLSVLLSRILMDEPVSRDDVSTLAAKFLDRQGRHMEAEENIFFPATERMLSELHWNDLESVMQNPADDPVFADAEIARYDRLREEVRRVACD
jgi:hemerythrin-like domain-containing protein